MFNTQSTMTVLSVKNKNQFITSNTLFSCLCYHRVRFSFKFLKFLMALNELEREINQKGALFPAVSGAYQQQSELLLAKNLIALD